MADIGVGLGQITVGIAPSVREVISTDIEPKQLQAIRAAVAKAGLKNVRVVEGGLNETRLAGGCCDAVVGRRP